MLNRNGRVSGKTHHPSLSDSAVHDYNNLTDITHFAMHVEYVDKHRSALQPKSTISTDLTAIH